MKQLKKIKIKNLAIIAVAASFLCVIFIPQIDYVGDGINSILGVVGLLFAILVGFFITDLWSRFQKIREDVAIEVSGLKTYYFFAKILYICKIIIF